MTIGRDHGGGLDAAVARSGGARADWLDLSTGINPVPATGRIVVLKSFGKFWGLAGLRLGFAIGTPQTRARFGRGNDNPVDLAAMLGPWPVSGPALAIGTRALADYGWADASRVRRKENAARLDGLMMATGAAVAGGTDLFRLYAVDDAAAWQDRLGRVHVLSRIFPYSRMWLRLGLPHPNRWSQLEAAL